MDWNLILQGVTMTDHFKEQRRDKVVVLLDKAIQISSRMSFRC